MLLIHGVIFGTQLFDIVKLSEATNTSDSNYVQSATIDEHGHSTHIDATRSNPNINTISNAQQCLAYSDDMVKLIVNTLRLCQQTMQQLAYNRQNT